MGKLSISFFVMDFILLFVLLGFIFVVFDLGGYPFYFELAVLVSFLFSLTMAMIAVYNGKEWGWTLIGGVLVLMLINTILIIILSARFNGSHMVVVLFSLAGMVVALLNLRESVHFGPKEGPVVDDGKEYYPFIDKMEPELANKSEEVKKEFSPGKYVASKKANKYHAPKCDWAARISKENQIWFNTKEEAEAKNFSADKCVE